MKVIVARSAGFCWGVRRAVDKARELAAGPVPVYTDGPLIHNEELLAELRRDGIRETADPAEVGRNLLIVRAHGVCPERRKLLNDLPAMLVDCTCPDVARIQGTIRKHVRQGFDIVIFGDAGHPEVSGLLGFAEGRGYVVDRAAAVAALPALGRVCVVSQSTQRPAEYERVAAAVRSRFPGALVVDTICAATKDRQEELVRLAGAVDAIVVVGGAQSANTRHLTELAGSLAPTFRVQTAADLDACRLGAFETIGLTAGASTPAFVLDAVRKRLERL